MEDTQTINIVKCTIPSLPGSVNEIYELNRHDSGLPRKRLKAEWALWCSQSVPWVPQFRIQENSIVRIDRCYFYKWFGKNNHWRRVDTSNMDKLLFDMISRAVGIDDHRFKLGMMDSRDSQENKVEVVISEVTEAEWRVPQ